MLSLVGREREITTALSAYVDARNTSSVRTLFIEGPSGIGKSALAHTFAHSIAGDTTVMTMRAARVTPELRDWLDAQPHDRGIVLIVEDAHRADDENLELLGATMQHCEDRPLLLAVTRSDEHLGEPQLSPSERIVLRELEPDAARTLAHAYYPRASDDVLDAIVARSRRIPYEIVVIASAAAGRAALSAQSVEHSARAAIAKRVAGMQPDQRAFLQVLSLLAGPVDLEIARRLLPAGHTIETFINAAESDLTLEGEDVHFRHELTAAAVLETVALKIPLHRRIIEAIKHGGRKRLEDRRLLAEHASASGDPQLARAALLDLAFTAAANSRDHHVIWASERYMRLAEPPNDRFVEFYTQFLAALMETRQRSRAVSVASHSLSEAQRRGLSGLGTLAALLVSAQWAVDRRDAAKASYERYTRAFVDADDLRALRDAAPWAQAS
jgi:hypothetical protein